MLHAFRLLSVLLLPVLFSARAQSPRPAFFDDFSYASGESLAAGSETVFAPGAWVTPDGMKTTRMWRRYNWDDHAYRNASVVARPYGIDVVLQPGFGGEDLDPVLTTGFVLPRSGVYAARVRFSPLQPGLNLIQAFWAISPDTYAFGDRIFWSEVDLEWSNYFLGDGRSRLHATLHGFNGGSETAVADCRVGGVASGALLPACRDENNQRMTAAGNESVLTDRFVTLLMSVDERTERVRFAARVDDGAVIDIGDAWGRALVLGQEHFPRRDMGIVFSQHYYDRRPGARLVAPQSLGIDWVYYAPDTGLSLDEVVEEVNRLRERGIERLATAPGAVWEPRGPSTQHTTRIEGPAAVDACAASTWTLASTVLGTRYDTEFTATLLNGRRVVEKTSVDDLSVTLTPPRRVDRIVLEVETKNYWYGHTSRDRREVIVRSPGVCR